MRKVLTPLERRMMMVLWCEGAGGVQKVLQGLAGEPRLAYTTVQTTLNVLHRKGWARRKLVGRAFEYSAKGTVEEADSEAVADLVEKVFRGSVDALLKTLVRDGRLEAGTVKEREGWVRAQRQTAQFFEATSDGVIFLDDDYVVTFINRRAREILSGSGDVLGKCLWDVYPAAATEESPFWTNYHRTMDEGVATSFEAYYPEPLNLFFDVEAFPSDEGILLFFRDVTGERRVRDELLRRREETERQYAEIEAVYRTAPIGLALFDLDDYHYLRLNERQAAFFGMKPEEIVGKTLLQMAPIPGLRELFDQVASGGPPVVNYPLEGTLVTDPDEYRYWTVSYFPVTGADGVIRGITAASLEITQQKKAELALIESEKLAAVGRLASSIAHEINNPLEAVTNLLYLARGSDDVETSREYLDSADHELRRVAAIASQTLRFHKQSTSPQEVTAETLIANVLQVYQRRIANAEATVETRYRAADPVRCFDGEIRQVISNLLINALDAVTGLGGGRVLIRAAEGCENKSGVRGMVITVADNGAGMSAEVVEKIFRAFYTTKGIMGTGLGLWICQEIIERHKGVLSVRSGVGKGTVFRIFLPWVAASR